MGSSFPPLHLPKAPSLERGLRDSGSLILNNWRRLLDVGTQQPGGEHGQINLWSPGVGEIAASYAQMQGEWLT